VSLILKGIIETKFKLVYIHHNSNIGLDFTFIFEHSETEFEHEKYLKNENPSKKKKENLDHHLESLYMKRIQSHVERKEFEDVFFQEFVPPKDVSTEVELKLEMKSFSIYLTGNYNKFERGISQTKWTIGDKKITENSTEEYISAPITEFTKSIGENNSTH
jgi:hypothetical protein